MTYESLSEFTPLGMHVFEKIFLGEVPEAELDLSNSQLVHSIEGSGAFKVEDFDSARTMAESVINALGTHSTFDMLQRLGFWAWLTFVLRDQLFPIDRHGRRLVKEYWRWYPSDPNDWQKAQRHLVRMPTLLLASLKDNADHLICGKPAVLPEIREQLTSQQEMFNPTFQRVARALYFDDQRGGVKRGAGGKSGGTPRRLAKIRKQLDVTWELDQLGFDEIIRALPKEFDRFKPEAVARKVP